MSGHARILIVDDEPNIRLMFRTTLESLGYVLVEAEDGDAALAALRRKPADLVLLDLGMPRFDGMETLRQLREAGDSTPVVIITAHGIVPSAMAAMKLGAIDFLSKPVSPDELRKVVAEVIGRHHLDRPEKSPASPAPAIAEDRFTERLTLAKRALNRREFDAAQSLLDEAVSLDEHSREAKRLSDLLRQARTEAEGSYRILRRWFE